MGRPLLARIWGGVFVIALSACSSHSVRIPNSLPVKLSAMASEAVVARLENCNSKIQSFRGLARATLTHAEDSSSFRYAIVFSKPDKLRLEALPSSAVYTLSLLVTSDQEMIFLDPASKTAHRGPVAASTVKRYIGVPVLPPDLMSLLTACAPLDGVSREELEIYEDTQQGLFQLRTKGLVYEMSSATFEARRAFLINKFDDSVALLVEWSDYRDVQGQNLPAHIKILIPEHAVSLGLEFTSSEINGAYAERLFQAQIPEDFKLQ